MSSGRGIVGEVLIESLRTVPMMAVFLFCLLQLEWTILPAIIAAFVTQLLTILVIRIVQSLAHSQNRE